MDPVEAELSHGETYRLSVKVVIPVEAWLNDAIRQSVEVWAESLEGGLKGTAGIETDGVDVVAEDAISLADLRHLRRFELEYRSYSSDGAMRPADAE
ncbi:MAG: hypothetical protein IRZ16_09705 [Myxococcaceae bacterium]|nr:hypothetical protein [Myxococcaceae bacterium]